VKSAQRRQFKNSIFNNDIKTEKKKRTILKFFEMVSAVILLLGKDGKIQMINEKGSRLMGYKQSEMTGKNWFSHYVPRRIRAELRLLFKKIVEGDINLVERGENAVIYKDGRERIFEWQNTIVKDDAGKIIGTLSYGMDVTEIKNNPVYLEKGEKKFRNLVENSPNMVMLINNHGKLIDCNITAAKILGFSKKELLSGDILFQKILPSVDKTRMFRLFKSRRDKKILKTQKIYEICFKRRDGIVINLDLKLADIEFDKEEIILLTGADVTKRNKDIEDLQELNLCSSLRSKIWEMTSGIKLSERGIIESFLKKTGIVFGARRLAYFSRTGEYFKCEAEWKRPGLMTSLKKISIEASIVDSVISKFNLPIKLFGIDELFRLVNDPGTKFVKKIIFPILKIFKYKPGFFVPMNYGRQLNGFFLYVSDREGFWTKNKKDFVVDISNIIGKLLYRKKLENELIENEKKYRLITENIADVVWTTDMQHVYTFMSPSVEWVAGYKPEELVGKSMSVVRDEERFESNTALIRSLAERKSEKSIYYETEIIKKDGSKFWAESIVSAINNAGGKITGFSGVTRDISERKRIEQILKVSERYFKALTEESSDIIVVVDKSGIINYVSPAVEKVLGYTQREFANMFFTVVRPISDKEDIFEDFVTIKDYMVKQMNARGHAKNGQVIYFDVTAKNLQNDKAINGIVVNFRDITGKKHAEENLKKIIWELEHTNSELEQFAYVASHDLKEPLRMISNYLDLIQLKYKNETNSEINEFINFAVDGARRMYDLIQALLLYSRIGKKAEDKTTVDLNIIVEKLAREYSDTLDGGRIEINKLPVVSARPVEMIQVFQNLIGNAIKFRSTIPPVISISASITDEEYLFVIQDNGIGIDMEYREKIFKLFERLHNDEKYSGTGIGLTICKKIITSYGGRIWIESEKNKGMRVLFTLSKGG
jgi:PAS domain S-box-containing protein